MFVVDPLEKVTAARSQGNAFGCGCQDLSSGPSVAATTTFLFWIPLVSVSDLVHGYFYPPHQPLTASQVQSKIESERQIHLQVCEVRACAIL